MMEETNIKVGKAHIGNCFKKFDIQFVFHIIHILIMSDAFLHYVY